MDSLLLLPQLWRGEAQGWAVMPWAWPGLLCEAGDRNSVLASHPRSPSASGCGGRIALWLPISDPALLPPAAGPASSTPSPLLASLPLAARPLQPPLDFKHLLAFHFNGAAPLSLFPNFSTVRAGLAGWRAGRTAKLGAGMEGGLRWAGAHLRR